MSEDALYLLLHGSALKYDKLFHELRPYFHGLKASENIQTTSEITPYFTMTNSKCNK